MSITVEFIKDVNVLSISLLDDSEEHVFVKKGSFFEAEGMSMDEDRVTLRFPDESVFSDVPISCIKPAMKKSDDEPLKKGCGGCKKAKEAREASRKEIEKARQESAKKDEQ